MLSGSAARNDGSTPSDIPILSNSRCINSAVASTLEGPGPGPGPSPPLAVATAATAVEETWLLLVLLVEAVARDAGELISIIEGTASVRLTQAKLILKGG